MIEVPYRDVDIKLMLEPNYMNVANDLLRKSAVISFDVFKYVFKSDPKNIIDIGSCVGLYSMHMSRLCNNTESKIYSFEPVEESFNIFEKNIKLNNITNIIPINKGLYSEETQLNISLPRPDSLPERVLQNDGMPGLGRYSIFGDDNLNLETGDKEFLSSWGESVKSVIADFTTIDNFSKEYNISGVDILKIDCEGAEELIFKSSPEFFKKCKVLFVEHHKGFDPDDRISHILDSFGFVCSYSDNDKIWVNNKILKDLFGIEII